MSRQFADSIELAKRICSIIGVDPYLVTNVRIEMPAGGLLKIHVERVVTQEEATHIVSVFEAVE